ncbi:MAG TPA: hypothetical protein VLE73_04385 [Candidatus Saccharimonadales bacterium]|nr:hypothetical protein [Candidatus Saccharimonadales bacterium]
MPEQSPNTLTVAASPSIEWLIAARNVTLEPEALALAALAEQLKVPLPRQPRIVIVNTGEALHVGADDHRLVINLARETGIDFQYKDDLVVTLPHSDVVQNDVTKGVALELLLRRRAKQQRTVNRIGGGLLVIGTGVVGTSPLTAEAFGYIGLGLAATSLAVLTFTHSRGMPAVPDSQELPAPVVFRERT